jgi:hypothetical protein
MAKRSANPDAGKKTKDYDDPDSSVQMDIQPARRKRGPYSGLGSGSPYRQAKVRNPYSARFGGMKVGQ